MRAKILTILFAVVIAASVAADTRPAVAGRPGAEPSLTDSRPCPDQPGFTCSMLTVPLDHRGRVAGTLDLQVATADNVAAPRGVLLFLVGGPGQAGVPHIARLANERLPELSREHRFVMIDQRGTGEFGALYCRKLQEEVGMSDVAASEDAVAECARLLGDRARFYGTDQTVADLDLLRRALGAPRMVVDGVSYGSFTAARYALAYPGNVGKLVLDSVVPHHVKAEDALYLAALRGTADVLRAACAAPPACGHDPVADLAEVVRDRSPAEGVQLFDTLVTYEYVDPTYRAPHAGDVIGALHAAAKGDPTRVDAIIRRLAPGGGDPGAFSTGLHAATLCADFRFPWGTAETPLPERKPALDRFAAALRESDTWPFTAQVAAELGFIQTCLPWPVEPANSNPDEPLPNVPVLLVNGDRDLATPVEWARRQAEATPLARLVVVPGESHSIQSRERGHKGRDAVVDFVLE